jgi:enoyl-CoA hydratase/carnithine racemase
MNQSNRSIAQGLTTSSQGLDVYREGGVVTLTINRLDEQNRLSPELMAYLLDLTAALRDDADVHVVVITGAGQQLFSAGILNPEIRASLTKQEVISLVRFANRCFDAVESLPQIVIAAINGRVVAGAVELCLACDIRYASDEAVLCMPEAAWGGFPGAGGPVRLPELVGRARALEMICTAREVGAAELLRIDLVQQLFKPEALMASVGDIARRMASCGPLAVKGAKRIAHVRQEPGFAAARGLSDALRTALEFSADVDEGMAAHQEKRTPRFSGH